MKEGSRKLVIPCGKKKASMLDPGHKVSPYRPDLTAIKKLIKDWSESKQLTYRG